MTTLYSLLTSLRVKQMVANKPRLPKDKWDDKLLGGSGVVPQRWEDQHHEYRRRQADFDVICELRTLDEPVLSIFAFLGYRATFK